MESGHVYRCFCSSLRLDLLRKEAIKNREIPKYDNRCRELSRKEVESKLKANEQFTLRLKLSSGESTFHDLIHGRLTLDSDEGDPILLKSDGYPTYHLANVVDDHLMGITHVLRGSEWQLSTPKHLRLYAAFGWDPPFFAHLPLIINSEGEKLSKRNDDIRIEYLRRKGMYPQVLLSYINSMNTFTHPSNPTWSLDDLISGFTLESIGTAASRLSVSLMNELNAQYMNHLMANDPSSLVQSVRALIRDRFGHGEELSDEFILRALKWSMVSVHFLLVLSSETTFHLKQLCPEGEQNPLLT